MYIYIWGFCLNDNAVSGRISYDVLDEWGYSINRPSACEWIVPGTIED